MSGAAPSYVRVIAAALAMASGCARGNGGAAMVARPEPPAPRPAPNLTGAPYLVVDASLPAGQVSLTALLTVGDAVGAGYRMAGQPDGLGAYADGGQIVLLMNHELRRTAGAVRAHGSRGAFVSEWRLDPISLRVLEGRDLVARPTDLHTWSAATSAWNAGTTALEHFCSATLASESAFFFQGRGTRARLFLTGEETRPPSSADHGRAFAYVATGPAAGQAWELPALGRMAYENVVASPHAQAKTVVALTDDADVSTAPLGPAPSELYLYVGTKAEGGNDVERAGLANGRVYGVQIAVDEQVIDAEDDAFGLGGGPDPVRAGRFRLVDLGDAARVSGVAMQRAAVERRVTRLQRPEDGHWDPRPERRHDFYFVTTAHFGGHSRLWRLRFDDVERPEAGGRVDILLFGDEGPHSLDNLAIDRRGRAVLQEDPGATAHLAAVWLYDIETGRLRPIARHDPALFAPGGAGLLTLDEESSGVTDAEDVLGPGWFFLDVQAHYPLPDPELVSGGQLLALWIDPAFRP